MAYHGNIKCDCGHTQKDHYGLGFCYGPKCGCTWFYPSIEYIARKRGITLTQIKKEIQG